MLISTATLWQSCVIWFASPVTGSLGSFVALGRCRLCLIPQTMKTALFCSGSENGHILQNIQNLQNQQVPAMLPLATAGLMMASSNAEVKQVIPLQSKLRQTISLMIQIQIGIQVQIGIQIEKDGCLMDAYGGQKLMHGSRDASSGPDHDPGRPPRDASSGPEHDSHCPGVRHCCHLLT